MPKDTGVPASTIHVVTEQTGVGVVPLRGVANTGSATARLETTDTGVETWQFIGPIAPLPIAPAQTSTNPAGYSLYHLVKDTIDYTQAHDGTAAWTKSFDDYGQRNDLIASRGFHLKAENTNTARIWVGNDQMFPIGSLSGDAIGNPSGKGPAWRYDASNVYQTTLGVDTPMGYPLDAGDTMFLQVRRASQIYFVSASGTQTLYWLPE